MSAPTWPGQSKTSPPDRFIPSAPTLHKYGPESEFNVDGIKGQQRDVLPVTPADVRLWLLERGAMDRSWCEEHDAPRTQANPAMCLQVTAFPDDAVEYEASVCRMVSVLVYKEEK